jgi:hypothetical protein
LSDDFLVHLSSDWEELFFVLEGQITFWITNHVINRSAGDTAFVPRGVPHCFKNSSHRPARVLILFTPGDIEGFFDCGRPLANGSAPSDEMLIEQIVALARSTGSSCSDHRRYPIRICKAVFEIQASRTLRQEDPGSVPCRGANSWA